MSNPKGTAQVSRHFKYYFDDPGCHILLVESTLYRLSLYSLSRHSRVFDRTFKEARELASSSPLGQSDDNPISIPQLSSRVFDLFVEHHCGFPRLGSKYTKEELSLFLSFCRKYECEMTTQFLMYRVQESSDQFHPAELLKIATMHRNPTLLRSAFKSLVNIPLINITKAHRTTIGPNLFAVLATAQFKLDQHRRIVAAEAPDIGEHADDCDDPDACEEEWQAVWWNGMGRFLLDGRNPLSYDEALRRFKAEMDFGTMGEGCKEELFEEIDEHAVFGFADSYISEVCDRLVKKYC